MQQLNSKLTTKIILAEPRGFCAGVNRAIEIVDRGLEIYGAPIYVRHEIVHNHHVVNSFKDRGVIFIEKLEEVPDNSRLIFSAHGTAPEVLEAARKRGLFFIDAVCPLVTKVHLEIAKAIKENKKVIYIGHRGHQEVLGAMGYRVAGQDDGSKTKVKHACDEKQDIYLVETLADIEKLAEVLKKQNIIVATQTTLSQDDTAAIVAKLQKTFPSIELPKSDDICYATQNRQDAVKELVKVCDYILIIGSKNSSNTLRLLELAKKSGIQAELVPDPELYEVSANLTNKSIGISSGASAPESLVEALVKKIKSKISGVNIENLQYKEEKVTFPLPEGLK